MTVIDTPEGIELYHLIAARGALKLERLGMRHSKLGSIRKPWAIKLGLKPSAKIDEVIEAITKLIVKE